MKLKIEKFLLDTLFPVSCLSCGKSEDWICKRCLESLEILSAQTCPYCEKEEMDKGKICPRCRKKFLQKNQIVPLDYLIVVSSYRKNNLAHFIHFFKYNFISNLHAPLGNILVKGILQNNLPLPDLIIPVPLHPRRERWRGFNQSELLVNYISKNLTPGLEIPIFNSLLVRSKYSKPQMKIKNYQERQKNIRNIFKLSTKDPSAIHEIKDKRILLVDDIATTGATLFECAKILKQNGAKTIFGAVLARQEIL